MSTATVSARARIDARTADRLRHGAPWIYREGLKLDVPTADVVELSDGREVVATAVYCANGPIALRVLELGSVALDHEFLVERLRRAWARRIAMLPDADAFRWLHGEADGVPGVFIDRYRDIAVMQITTAAMDVRREMIVDAIKTVMAPRMIAIRNDGSARDFESLPREKLVAFGAGPTTVEYHDAGNIVGVDVMEDGKTGGFLDQLENHAAALQYARAYAGPSSSGLDAFCYHGGFAMALARAGLSRVVAIDESSPAIARARHNAKVNHLDQIDFLTGNAFDQLRRLESAGERFDVVVVDPPALAKRRSGDTAAERAYRELNLRAFRLVAPGGIVVTASCSGRLSPERFGELVAASCAAAGRRAQLLERRGGSRDHAPLVGVPETEYLKCWILRVL